MDKEGFIYMVGFILSAAATKLKENPDLDVAFEKDLIVVKKNNNPSFYATLRNEWIRGADEASIELGQWFGGDEIRPCTSDICFPRITIDLRKSMEIYGKDELVSRVSQRVCDYLTRVVSRG